MTQSEADAAVSACGMTAHSSGGCTTKSNKKCTSFDQIWSDTIDGVCAFKRASGCAVTITGGSETGHASGTYSHGTGYKVDIALSACVTNFIQTKLKKIATRSDGAAQYQSAGGNIYALESWLNHWDLLYKGPESFSSVAAFSPKAQASQAAAPKSTPPANAPAAQPKASGKPTASQVKPEPNAGASGQSSGGSSSTPSMSQTPSSAASSGGSSELDSAT